MRLSPGTRAGSYEVVAKLGEGGMGEVYRARDARLGRDVAIKIIHADVRADADRRRRFEQEARAAGQLNHPNILVVHDVGRLRIDDGSDVDFIVTELLEGETLRSRLARGRLPAALTLEFALQIARGLQAAHDKGIVHRDLKPDNIFVAAGDRIKILDFGLAKLKEPPRGSAEETVAAETTEPGTVMGTAGYMSPEQIRGEDVDHRSDIFAFGAIVHEMAAGVRAFDGPSGADQISAILTREPPDAGELNAAIPAPLARIIRRCLSKPRSARFQSASDLSFALESVSAMPHTGTTAPALRQHRSRLGIPAMIVLAAIAALALASRYFITGTASTTVYTAAMSSPSGLFLDQFAVSPDGRWLAFTDAGADGTRLWVRSLDRAVVKSELIADSAGAADPFWSPDSRSIGFFAQRQLKVVDLAGGRPRVVCPVTESQRGGTWNADHVILFTPNLRGPVYRVSDAGGESRAVTTIDTSRKESTHRWPVFLPDGRHFIYFARSDQLEYVGLYVASIDAPAGKFLTASSSHAVYAPPGVLFYVRDGALVAHRFDASSQQLTGEPVTIVPEGGQTLTLNRGAISASATGVLVYGPTQKTALTWFARDGKPIATVGEADIYTNVELSDDDQAVLLERPDQRSGANDIYIYDFRRQVPTRLTSFAGSDFHSIWWPGSRQIAWASNRSGGYEIYRRDASGAGDEERLPAGGQSKYPNDVSPDGRFLVYEEVDPATSKTSLHALELSTGGTMPLLESGFNESQARLSPDGRWMAFSSDRDGRFEIYVVDARMVLPGPGEPLRSRSRSAVIQRVSRNGGTQPTWRRDGKVAELFFLAADRQLMVAPMTAVGPSPAQKLFQVPAPDVDRSLSTFAASRDGQRFLVLSRVAESGDVTIVFNWPAAVLR